MAESEKKTTVKAAEKTKGFVGEFKKFIMRGNVIDLAVGVIIGAAFGNIVTALTENVINPLIGCIGNPEVDGFVIPLIKGQAINLGAFITAVINFLIMAFVLFIIVKAMNKAMTVGKKKEPEAAPTTKICPFCKSEINKDATRCPHCTSELDK
ncbi:MAG: large conductance mechanosensitive channel protein MscL [Lachnospiraceae bacterium]|nr:large conductance mechanosensitive channel protein MscL [Lachnospiraceae bacterium]